MSARPSIGNEPRKVIARHDLAPLNVVSQSNGFTAEDKHTNLDIALQEYMQTAEESVAEANGHTEHERARFGGGAAGVKFRLRTVVSARTHLATRQCHNEHANCWEMITASITDLIKLCQREQDGDSVSAQWFQDIRSVLKREVQIGLEEAMANSPADDGWTKEQWEQILMDPQQFDLEDLKEVRVNAMQRARHAPKKPWQRDVLRRKSGRRWR